MGISWTGCFFRGQMIASAAQTYFIVAHIVSKTVKFLLFYWPTHGGRGQQLKQLVQHGMPRWERSSAAGGLASSHP